MADVEIQKKQQQLEDAFAAFEQEHPEVAQALKVMNISFPEYLQALAALKQVSSTTGNSTTNP